MIVTLEEMKQYLRVDYPDDDGILEAIIILVSYRQVNINHRITV